MVPKHQRDPQSGKRLANSEHAEPLLLRDRVSYPVCASHGIQ